MIMQSVNSSNLASVGYDDETGTLYIKFHSGTYKYFNVPKVIHSGLMNASSKGSYHAAHIKNNYRYEKI